MSTSQTRLGAAADDRKTRLAQLRSLKRKEPPTADGADGAGDAAAHHPSPKLLPSSQPSRNRNGARDNERQDDSRAAADEPSVAAAILSGRNYDPDTRNVRLGFDAPPQLTATGPTLERQAADVEAETRRRAVNDAADDRGIDLDRLRPRKPNWDLRRDLGARLAVLDVRTENAMARMVRERIAAEELKRKGLRAGGGRGGGGGGGGGVAAAASAASASATSAAARGQDTHMDGGGGIENGNEETSGLAGPALVESLKVMEQEGEDEWRRERELEEELVTA